MKLKLLFNREIFKIVLTAIRVLAIIFSLFLGYSAHAMLIASPPNVTVDLLWERVLLVYDPLSASQNLMIQGGISGVNTPFAVLIPTPRQTRFEVTNSSIWSYLYELNLKKNRGGKRKLSIQPYSLIMDLLIPTVGQDKASHNEEVNHHYLKRDKMELHIEESGLYNWLISRGMSLSAEAQLSVKYALRNGLAIAAYWVNPPLATGRPIHELVTPVWVHSTSVEQPVYYSMQPSQISIFSDDVSHIPARTLLLSILSERDYYPFDTIPRVVRPLSLVKSQVLRLNSKVKGVTWDFHRGGVLNQLDLPLQAGMQYIRFGLASAGEINRENKASTEVLHILNLSIELLLLAIYILWWLWFRYSRESSKRVS